MPSPYSEEDLEAIRQLLEMSLTENGDQMELKRENFYEAMDQLQYHFQNRERRDVLRKARNMLKQMQTDHN